MRHCALQACILFIYAHACIAVHVRERGDGDPVPYASESGAGGFDSLAQVQAALGDGPVYEEVPAANAGKRAGRAQAFPKKFAMHGSFVVRPGLAGNALLLRNPDGHFDVFPPQHGCGSPFGDGENREWPSANAEARGCIFATNAGFFNTKTGECIGNVVSNSTLIQSSNHYNAGFGIRENGSIVVGYVPEDEVRGKVPGKSPFRSFVNGVVWIVRSGKSYVRESARAEDLSVQETGRSFITVQSARTAIGVTAAGEVLIATVDGKSWSYGADLYALANLMIDLGAVHAINLDGGGSTTAVLDGTVVNSPSDKCPHDPSRHTMDSTCERPVTTIVCVHDAPPAFKTHLSPLEAAAFQHFIGHNKNEKRNEYCADTLQSSEYIAMKSVLAILAVLLVGSGYVNLRFYLRQRNSYRDVDGIKLDVFNDGSSDVDFEHGRSAVFTELDESEGATDLLVDAPPLPPQAPGTSRTSLSMPL